MSVKRRDFIKSSAVLAAGVAISSNSLFAQNKPQKKLRIGMIGVGLRGQNHLNLILKRDDVDLISICDIDEIMLATADKMITKSGKKKPLVYKDGPYAYQKLLAAKDIDAIIISTPWEWHKSQVIEAIESGIKYVGVEVILGITLQDHWDVVRAAEQYKAQVMMLENVCYRRDVMAVLNMVRQNVFGEIVHLQGGYQHDLRAVKFNNGIQPYGGGVEFGENAFSEARWRTEHSVHRNGDLYPTHGIGPVANMINLNRGNRMISLCSFSSNARGLHEYVVANGGENHKNAKVNFRLGDVVTTSIKCNNGETILLQHDTNLPRPYSLGFRVQGTKGLWMDVAKGIHVEGVSKAHAWDDVQSWIEKYDHPLWKKYGEHAQGAGHGGMDFFVVHAFVEAAKRALPTPQDVYDAAAWSAIVPLSEKSIELGNETVEFPDFTSGKWMTRKNDFALTDDF
ncbi:Gfo/Idh/MocA family protein [Polluticaenibacter yanchengensis]|uniref:Gfo/Idh/MocA family oxidoreductase n=1 Tax=Polluticaenibacter yanchengensis TaxID=3014562 RepID=A0ABT4UPD3_9BACT|nr:Gfo/Idh/MocA family oxidoreductase [Chitinophagaceae bacterium LY-5]